MSITVRGQAAVLKWGYHDAATLGSWTLYLGTLTAAVVSADQFRITQQPIVFVASHAAGAWRWPIEALSIADGTLTARLGPQETD